MNAPMVVIYDFSGMSGEENLAAALSSVPGAGDVRLVDCRNIEGTSCYCDPGAETRISSLVPGAAAGGEMTVNRIDTGDYHYMTKLLTDDIMEPFSLIVFDHHPDMQSPAFGDILSCGGWVREALESNPNIENVLLIGINPELLGECGGFPERVTAVTKDAADDDRRSMLSDALDAVGRLKGRRVYLSIDTDVLGRSHARTDWDQGNMSAEELETLIRTVADGSKIIGADVCGGITASKGATAEDRAINIETDMRILSVFMRDAAGA